MKLRYRAYNAQGRLATGELEAESLLDGRNRLYQQGLEVVQLLPITPAHKPSRSVWLSKPQTRDWLFFCKQFAAYDQAGIDQPSAVRMLGETATHPLLQRMLQQVHRLLYGGLGMIEAMRESGGFPNLILGLLAAGERSGGRDRILLQLARHYGRELAVANTIRSSLVYPLFVVVATLGVTAFLLGSLVPQMTGVMQGLGTELPLITRTVVGLSQGLGQWGWAVAAIAALSVVALYRYGQTPAGRQQLDGWILRLPILGPLWKMQILARIGRVTALLLEAGIPLQDCLGTVAEAALSQPYRQSLLAIDRELKQGLGTFSDALLAQKQLYPPLLAQMAQAGERSGKLPSLLVQAADYFEQEVDTLARQLAEALTPALTLLLGGLVGGVVAAVILPYFSILQGLSS